MTVSGGYIKLYRQIQNHEIWRDPVRAFAWIDLLMLASFNGHRTIIKNRAFTVNAGDFVASTRFLRKRWRWGSGKTQVFIGYLIAEQMIVKIRSGSGSGSPSVYHIVNWDSYQGHDVTNRSTSRSTSGALPERLQHESPHSSKAGESLRRDKKGKKYSFSALRPKKNTSALRRTFSDLHIGESRKSFEPEDEFDEKAAQKSLEKELEETEARLRSKPNLTKKEKHWLEIRTRKKKQEKTKND